MTTTLTRSVNENRRGYLSKILAGGAAAVAILVMCSVAMAQVGPGQANGRAVGPPKKDGPRDPAAVAARLIKDFDRDGDGKLNAKELTAALTARQERIGDHDRPGGPGGRRGPGGKQGPDGQGGHGGPGGPRGNQDRNPAQ